MHKSWLSRRLLALLERIPNGRKSKGFPQGSEYNSSRRLGGGQHEWDDHIRRTCVVELLRRLIAEEGSPAVCSERSCVVKLMRRFHRTGTIVAAARGKKPYALAEHMCAGNY
jgi:hypothetical protein